VKFARIVYATATEAAPPKSGDGQCTPFAATPRLFTQTGKLVETTGELTVLNSSESRVAVGDEIVACQDLSGFWSILETGGSPSQMIEFEVVENDSSGSGSASGSSSDEDACGNDSPIEGLRGKVIAVSCGASPTRKAAEQAGSARKPVPKRCHLARKTAVDLYE
jgi:hypothetical protein